jgi:hypothetical protein
MLGALAREAIGRARQRPVNETARPRDLSGFVKAGRGMTTKPARVTRFFHKTATTGCCYRHVAVWAAMSLMTDPG